MVAMGCPPPAWHFESGLCYLTGDEGRSIDSGADDGSKKWRGGPERTSRAHRDESSSRLLELRAQRSLQSFPRFIVEIPGCLDIPCVCRCPKTLRRQSSDGQFRPRLGRHYLAPGAATIGCRNKHHSRGCSAFAQREPVRVVLVPHRALHGCSQALCCPFGPALRLEGVCVVRPPRRVVASEPVPERLHLTLEGLQAGPVSEWWV